MYSQSNISRFQRKVRNDPYYGIFKYRFYFTNDKTPASEIIAWLEERYQRWEGHQYRVSFYASIDGNYYAHCVYMQSIAENDLLYAKMQWNLSDLSVQRGDRKRAGNVRGLLPSKANARRSLYTHAEAETERLRLSDQATSAGWSAATLRAKHAWVTMRTLGWTPQSSKKPGA